MAEQLRAIGGEADRAAIDRHHRLFHTARLGNKGMGFHVATFAMHGDGDFGADPPVHGFQFRPPGMARNVHMRLFFSNDLDPAGGQRILHPANGEFVAGYLL